MSRWREKGLLSHIQSNDLPLPYANTFIIRGRHKSPVVVYKCYRVNSTKMPKNTTTFLKF